MEDESKVGVSLNASRLKSRKVAQGAYTLDFNLHA